MITEDIEAAVKRVLEHTVAWDKATAIKYAVAEGAEIGVLATQAIYRDVIKQSLPTPSASEATNENKA